MARRAVRAPLGYAARQPCRGIRSPLHPVANASGRHRSRSPILLLAGHRTAHPGGRLSPPPRPRLGLVRGRAAMERLEWRGGLNAHPLGYAARQPCRSPPHPVANASGRHRSRSPILLLANPVARRLSTAHPGGRLRLAPNLSAARIRGPRYARRPSAEARAADWLRPFARAAPRLSAGLGRRSEGAIGRVGRRR